ncbi:MAG: hypothetical protein AAF386_04810, partial [Pseudomonadota bacterium]
VTLVGLIILLWCVVGVVRARKANLTDAEMKTKLQSAVTWNLVAMGLSGLGLMMVVVGLIL